MLRGQEIAETYEVLEAAAGSPKLGPPATTTLEFGSKKLNIYFCLKT